MKQSTYFCIMNARISGTAMLISMVFLGIFLGYWLRQSYRDAGFTMRTKLAFDVVSTSSKLKDSIIVHFIQNEGVENTELSFTADSIKSIWENKASIPGTRQTIIARSNGDHGTRAEWREVWTENRDSGMVNGARQMKIIKTLDTLVANSDMNIFLGSDPFSNQEIRKDFNYDFWTVLKKIKINILLAVLLYLLVGFSFYLVYRNLKNEQKLTKLKNNFISNMTHELKTPLSTISVALEAINQFDVIENKAKTRDYLTISQKELSRLSLLVDKVLSFQKMDSGLEDMKKDEIVVQELIQKVTESMQLQIEKKDANLVTVMPEDRVTINGDIIHLTNVLYNLIDNALKYSPIKPKIEITLQRLTDRILLHISDNGIGIPETYLSGIFDRFYRVPDGERHTVKGYGLGLHYARQVAELHGGGISVISKENEGSCFTLSLPLNA